MKNIIGIPARGNSFYPRKKEIEKVFRSISAGNNLQIAAPRRVGKSSILYHFQDNPQDGYSFIYVDVEPVISKNDFYKAIYIELLKSEHLAKTTQLIEQLRTASNRFLQRLSGINVLEGSIELDEAKEMNYEDQFFNFMHGVDLKDIKIVMMIDEFPEVILNIVHKNKGDYAEAIEFLQSNRAMRNNKDINGKIQFIYTGSNSLNITVAKFDSTSLINDLQSISVDPLSEPEARDLIRKVLATYERSITDYVIDHLLEKIEWLLPFYIQLVIYELISLIDAKAEISDPKLIETAFEKILEQRNQNYFDHYISRLRRLFKDTEHDFVRKVLSEVAQKSSLNITDLTNIAVDYGCEKDLKRYIQALMYDGYINEVEKNIYAFNSPVLKLWWLKYECN